MSNKQNIITLEAVHELVNAKAKDPGITPNDLFKSVDSVKSDDNQAFWKKFWVPVAVYSLSCLGMLFFSTDTSLHRLSLIVFGVTNIWGYNVLNKFNRKYWWVFLLDLLVLYAIYSDVISSETIQKLIENLIK